MLFADATQPESIRLHFDHPLMNKTTGHIIRMIGMLIEMFGVWGVYQASNSKNPWLISVPGAGSMPAAWLAVFAGLIIWLTGVFIVYSYRPTGRIKDDSSDELAP
jgi:hypothetical protein